MQLLNISERPSLASRLAMHLLVTAGAFIGMYCFLVIPGDAEMAIYFLDHLELTLSFCLLAIVWFNMGLFFPALEKHHLVGLAYIESSNSLKFELVNLFSKKAKQLEYSLAKISWEEQEISLFGVEAKKVVVFKLNSGKVLAQIDPSLNPWSWKRREIKMAMANLESISRSQN